MIEIENARTESKHGQEDEDESKNPPRNEK